MKNSIPTVKMLGKNMYLYWCYGSNLNQEQMSKRCPDAVPLERAELPSHTLLFRGNSRGFGVATVERDNGSSIPGALWAISERDLKTLDRYEGYPRLYTRGTIRVVNEDGQILDAMTYWMHQSYPKAMPSNDYITTIYNGYMDFGLDARRLHSFYQKHIDNLLSEELEYGL
ncbi:gamma-glutamylcyclotransferase family protein [Priestia megaterium]|uniref:gamma-glutamylcyclotransferase family protein n=1 Tax=Priestia megaterium TaxID=1404 RepID=UPI003F7D8C75